MCIKKKQFRSYGNQKQKSLQIWARGQTECLQVRQVERTVECAKGNKPKCGIVSECAILWCNFESKWPSWDIILVEWKWYWKVHRFQRESRHLEKQNVWLPVTVNELQFLFQIYKQLWTVIQRSDPETCICVSWFASVVWIVVRVQCLTKPSRIINRIHSYHKTLTQT